ncbi:uncharacterized protein B0P05DRAFT_588352 [Gilbertella persicaria]|uniref:uncharacterized protein n=1 Tax=Gilbertella persicaria TaxID=101096 RepID=UPI002220BE66|nr:uncharacterized protein B0P05DRAFT_588352 [Gilbertella persicaria]KAI8075935.1 hypothetical protein B0P05DRAFT_588352 [Gilbertella persicaria]
MTLPPPPPPPRASFAASKPLPPPPSNSDFRTAVIKNHWNDPSMEIFRKTLDKPTIAILDYQNVSSILKAKLDLCKSTFDNGPQKRILDDTERRISILLDELEKKEFSNEVIESLNILSQALNKQEYTKAIEVHTQLMTTHYQKHGNWIVGLKRLVDLTEKANTSV